MFLTELVHIDNEGWCIVADIHDTDGEINHFEFMTISGKEPKVFFCQASMKHRQGEKVCQLKYEESEKKLSVNDQVFFFVNEKESTGKYNAGSVKFGVITHIDDNFAVINDHIKIRIFSAFNFTHNFEQIRDTEALICETCKAIHTPR